MLPNEDEEFIKFLKSIIKPRFKIAEVGCWQGELTIKYGELIKENNGEIFLCDWFCGNINAGPGPHGFAPDNKNLIKENLINNINNHQLSSCLTILDGKSWEMAKLIPDQFLDLCLIDASHIYLDVKKDIDAFLPKVKIGGYLCGHDYEPHGVGGINQFSKEALENDFVNFTHCGVIQAVYDQFGYTNNLPGTSIWIVEVKSC